MMDVVAVVGVDGDLIGAVLRPIEAVVEPCRQCGVVSKVIIEAALLDDQELGVARAAWRQARKQPLFRDAVAHELFAAIERQPRVLFDDEDGRAQRGELPDGRQARRA